MHESVVRGVVYRVTHPDYHDLDHTIVVGRKHPGRFSPPGVGAVHVSLERETAIAELQRRAVLLGRPLAAFAPRTVFTLDVVLRRVLDLTLDAERDNWGIMLDEMQSDDYTRCHEVAEAARRAGHEAVRFPSATGSGVNLAIDYDRLAPGSFVEHRAHEELDLVALDRWG